MGREVDKNIAVIRTSVDKVEGAVYGMFVRGRERPAGWVPNLAGAGDWEGMEAGSRED